MKSKPSDTPTVEDLRQALAEIKIPPPSQHEADAYAPDEIEILAALRADTVVARHYSGLPVPVRQKFESFVDSLRYQSATPLRNALIRRRVGNAGRLFRFVLSLLRAMAARDGKPMAQAECAALVNGAGSKQYEWADYALIAEWLTGGSFKPISDMQALCFYDRVRFRRAFGDLLSHWEKVYRGGSRIRVKDVAQSVIDLDAKPTGGLSQAGFAVTVLKLAGVPDKAYEKNQAKIARNKETAARRLKREIDVIKKKRSSH
jgi:hypothetical protein